VSADAIQSEARPTADLRHLRRRLRTVLAAHRSKAIWGRPTGEDRELAAELERAILAKEVRALRTQMRARTHREAGACR
jgi:hypothetical protein